MIGVGEGNVGQIDGIDLKTITAHKAGANILLVPKSRSFIETNEIQARRTAEQIGSNIKIIPVETLEEAVKQLKALNGK